MEIPTIRNRRVRALASAAIILAVLAGSAVAEDWPQFRGPGGQGHSSESGLALVWSETKNVAWKTPLPGLGWSSPVVQGEQLWITTALEESNSLRAVCLDRQTGQIVRNVEVFRKRDLGRIASKNSHASPTPVLDGDRVYVHFGAHGTACLTDRGRVVWTTVLTHDHRHGPGGSPIVWNDLLIVNCDGADVQYVVALDKNSGQVRWRQDRAGEMAYSTPLLIHAGGVDQIVSSGGGGVAAYSPNTGTEIWRCRYEGHSVVPRPVFGHGLVFICSGYWNPSLYAIRPTGRGDVTDSHVVATFRRGVPHNPSPLLIDDLIYLASDMGVVTCYDAASGEQCWRERIGGNISASPLFAEGRIYVTSEEGTTTVLAPGRKPAVLATSQVAGRVLASLAVSGQAIFLRTDSSLYCICDAKPSVTSPPLAGN